MVELEKVTINPIKPISQEFKICRLTPDGIVLCLDMNKPAS